MTISMKASNDNSIQNNKTHYFRNTLLGTTSGALVGAGLGYSTRKFFSNNLPTDEFVHNVVKNHYSTIPDEIMKSLKIDAAFDMIRELKGTNLDIDTVKKFIEKHKLTNQKSLSDDVILDKFKKLQEKYCKNYDYVKQQLTNAYDVSTKKINYSKLKDVVAIDVDATKYAMRLESAMKYSAIGAAIVGGATLLCTKLMKKSDSQ